MQNNDVSVSPVLPTGQEIFDTIMGGIEPELVSGNEAALAATYANETPDQKQERMARYQSAFETYDVRYKEYCDTMNAQVNAYRHDALRMAEGKSHDEETGALRSLEASFEA